MSLFFGIIQQGGGAFYATPETSPAGGGAAFTGSTITMPKTTTIDKLSIKVGSLSPGSPRTNIVLDIFNVEFALFDSLKTLPTDILINEYVPIKRVTGISLTELSWNDIILNLAVTLGQTFTYIFYEQIASPVPLTLDQYTAAGIFYNGDTDGDIITKGTGEYMIRLYD